MLMVLESMFSKEDLHANAVGVDVLEGRLRIPFADARMKAIVKAQCSDFPRTKAQVVVK